SCGGGIAPVRGRVVRIDPRATGGRRYMGWILFHRGTVHHRAVAVAYRIREFSTLAGRPLEQLALRRGRPRRDEARAVQRRKMREPEPSPGTAETRRQQLRKRPLAAHAAAEGTVVIASAAHLRNQAHHMR